MKISGSIVGWLLTKVQRAIREEFKKPIKEGESVDTILQRIHKAAMKVFMRHCAQEHNLVALTMEALEVYLAEVFWPSNKSALENLPKTEIAAYIGEPCSGPMILTVLKNYERFLENDFRRQMTEKFKVEYPLSYDQTE